MKLLIQRVSEASVDVEGRTVGRIGPGLLAYLGIHKDDTERDAAHLSAKLANLRVFEDAEGKMNLSCAALGRPLLVIPQFTLCADTSKGHRPNFMDAMRPEAARQLYERFVALCRATGLAVETGEFGATMAVRSVNDGPVSLILECGAEP